MTGGRDEAYAAALRLLAGRDLSRAQLRERLERRGFRPEAASEAIDRLARQGAADDFRVAVVRARGAAARHRGRVRAAADIRAAGIDADVARRALDEVFGSLDERALAEQALVRRLKTPSITSPAEFRRLHAFLLRQGFAPSDVMAVLRGRTRGMAAGADEES
jgi:regulatory protein